MKISHLIEDTFLISATAILYLLGFEFQGWLFSFTEHVPGVNWFYLPAGLRVLFVLVTGVYGALGITIATIIIDLLHMQELNGASLLLTAIASGFGAWAALALMRFKNLIARDLVGLTSAALLQYALFYSALNALFHQSVWWAFKREGALFMVDVWPMFVGDMLGAVVFLYGLKLILVFRQRQLANTRDFLN